MKVGDDKFHVRMTSLLTASQITAHGLTKWKTCLYLVCPLDLSSIEDTAVDVSGANIASDSRPSYGGDRRNFSFNAPSGDRFAGECARSGPAGIF